MNFFKIFLTLLFLIIASSKSYADNHDQNLSDGVKEIAQEIQEDEEVPLNDPFAGNEGTSGSAAMANISEEEKEDEMSLYNFKLAGLISGKDNSYISLVNNSVSYKYLQLYRLSQILCLVHRFLNFLL